MRESQLLSNGCWKERIPQRSVSSVDQRNGRRANRTRRLRSIDVLRRCEPGPYHLTRQTQRIEPCRIVIVHTRRENLTFPRRGWGLEASQLIDQRGKRVGAFDLMVGGDF